MRVLRLFCVVLLTPLLSAPAPAPVAEASPTGEGAHSVKLAATVGERPAPPGVVSGRGAPVHDPGPAKAADRALDGLRAS